MRDYMDELLREAYGGGEEMPDGLEMDVAGKLIGRNMRRGGGRKASAGRRSMRMKMYPALAMLCGAFLLGGAVTAYGAANGLSVGQLFDRIWGEREQKDSLSQFHTELEVLSEKSTFKDIDIQPVKAVSDGLVTYVVVRVEGIGGFHLTDEMTFDVIKIDDRQESTKSMGVHVLRREGDAMYVALASTAGVVKDRRQKIHIEIYDLFYAKMDEMGRASEIRGMIVDGEYIRYTEASYAAKGEYRAEISCDVQSDELEIDAGEYGTFQVRALSMTADRDIQEVGLVDAGGRDNKVYAVMKDGSRVEAYPSGGTEGESTEFELQEPVDIKRVKAIRVLGRDYRPSHGK